MLKRVLALLMAILLTVAYSSDVYAALTDLDPNNERIIYYDYHKTCEAPDASTIAQTETGSSADLSKVYVLGDSITLRAQTSAEYEKKLKDAGAGEVKIVASGAGNLSQAGTAGVIKSGLQSLTDDKDYLKDATTVIMAHGTNGITDDEVKKAMTAIGSKAGVYWVDVALIEGNTQINAGGSYGGMTAKSNKVIYGNKNLGYSIISWAKAVDSKYKPEDASGAPEDTGGNFAGNDPIHPSIPKGINKYVDTVISGLKGGAGGTGGGDVGSLKSIADKAVSDGKAKGIDVRIKITKAGTNESVEAGQQGRVQAASVIKLLVALAVMERKLDFNEQLSYSHNGQSWSGSVEKAISDMIGASNNEATGALITKLGTDYINSIGSKFQIDANLHHIPAHGDGGPGNNEISPKGVDALLSIFHKEKEGNAYAKAVVDAMKNQHAPNAGNKWSATPGNQSVAHKTGEVDGSPGASHEAGFFIGKNPWLQATILTTSGSYSMQPGDPMDTIIKDFGKSIAQAWSGGGNPTPAQAPPSETPAKVQNDNPAPATSNLTKDEKAAKLLVPLVPAGVGAEDISKYGGMGGDMKSYDKNFFDKAKELSKGQFVPMVDEESGYVSRYGFTKSQTAKQLGEGKVDDVKAFGKLAGQKMKEKGIEVDWAPVLDTAHGKSGGHLSDAGGGQTELDWRAFSDKPDKVEVAAGAFADGLAESGIKPTFKHFPGIGAADKHSDLEKVTVPYDSEQAGIYKKLANKNSALVMMSNAFITGIGDDNKPASANGKLIQDKLRSEVGFTGTIISDDLGSGSSGPGKYAYSGNVEKLAVDSIKAGTDLLIVQYSAADKIAKKIAAEVPDERLDAAYEKYTSVAKGSSTQQEKEQDNNDACCSVSDTTSTVSTVSGSSGGDGGGCGEQNTPVSKQNKDQVWSYFNNKFQGEGYSKDEAEKATSGIMGNWLQESGFSPDRHKMANPGVGCGGASGPITGTVGMGIAQWCGGRQQLLADYAKERGKEAECLGIQLEFTWKEMEGLKLNKDMKGKSPSEASHMFDKIFEVSEGSGEREAKAETLYKEYTGKDPGSLSSDSGGTGNACATPSDTNVPPAECSAVVEEIKKLREEKKIASINGTENLDQDLANCGKVKSGAGCVGVEPEIVRAVIGITKHIDSLGLGPVTFANFNKGHDCDNGKHGKGRAIDMWYGAGIGGQGCNGDLIYTEKKCVETIKWIQQNHKEYDIGAALHNPCAIKDLTSGNCNQDGVQYYEPTEGEMIHISIGKDGRW